jgi:hypothetical protein
MILLDELFDTFDLRVDSTEYDYHRREMTAGITFTIPIARFDEETHEGLARRFDGHDDLSWRIEALDIDDGPEVAWFAFRIVARTPAACRHLQARIAAARFWFEETAVA